MTTRQSPSQFGLCSWSAHPKTPAELVSRMRELGLKKVQLQLKPVYADPNVWGDVKKQLGDAGISIVSGMFGTIGENYSTLESIRETGGFVPDQHWAENFELARQTAACAQSLGLSLVSTHAGFIPNDANAPTYGKLVERLGKVADLFAQHNLVLVFETGQETADTLNGFLDKLNRPNVGINFDPANMILYAKGDPVESLRKLRPRVRQVHIKDAKRTTTPGTWGKEVPIAEGDVDWHGIFQVLTQTDYTGDLVIEREAGQDRVGDVRKAVERLSKLM